MANSKISALNSLTKATVDTTDVIPVVDTGSSETKKMTYAELIQPQDNRFRIAGSSDNTKLVAFEVDGLTTATTRTITVPDADLTLVGVDTTQTITAKTLTSPQINFGSDATGDMIYRTSAGVTARLPIGSTDQILAVSGGIPTWIANPSATAASTSTSGIVELATTAETETGTDATRAVTPDGLHDMTTLAGAAWFLDEDTMSSDSATKVASQQSIKAYVDTSTTTSREYSVNTHTGLSYITFPIILTGDGTTITGWTNTSFTVPTGGGAGNFVLTAGTNAELSQALPGSGTQTAYRFNEGKIVRLRANIKFDTIVGNFGFGLADDAGRFDLVETSTIGSAVRVLNKAGVLYAVSTASSANTNTNIDSGITDTSWNLYEFVFDPGTSFVVKINGTQVANITTNVPSTDNVVFGFGATTASDSVRIAGMTVSIEN